MNPIAVIHPFNPRNGHTLHAPEPLPQVPHFHEVDQLREQEAAVPAQPQLLDWRCVALDRVQQLSARGVPDLPAVVLGGGEYPPLAPRTEHAADRVAVRGQRVLENGDGRASTPRGCRRWTR